MSAIDINRYGSETFRSKSFWDDRVRNATTDVVMTLLVPAESVNTRVVITLFMTGRYTLNNSDVI